MTAPRRPAPSQRRLQRPPDLTGPRLSRFREVFLRHGLPVLAVGALLLLGPEQRMLLWSHLQPALRDPLAYGFAAACVLAGCCALSGWLDRGVDVSRLGWIVYLLALSIWEEWVFRLATPHWLESIHGSREAAILATNLVFGALHWFTLRWRLRWCVLAFLGGMAFSQQMATGDFTRVVLTHWALTFLNTPRPPGGRRRVG
ncbi:MAG: CPBP family intramembrane glutamic endopeptidase [Pseudomonadales bacterium]|jgi:hypothetical protein|nr:CPBP family intramembrane glutamic endopeptidase [Pseudomonadales bacterium]